MTTPVNIPQASSLHWRTGLAYGALAAPLAFVSLPLYVSLPHYYASVAQAPLAALGGVLLATRALDALIDPALGRLADRLFLQGGGRPWRAAALGCVVLAAGFALLWHPPTGSQTAMLAWLAGVLLLTTLAYSWVSILHQTWGTRWGGAPRWRASVTAWREAATLSGVLLASGLALWLGKDTTSAVLALGLALGLWSLYLLRSPGEAQAAQRGARPSQGAPWSNAGFRWLMLVFVLNGIASAIPATLLPFFVADRLQAVHLQPWFLLGYFGAAALGLPLWVQAVSRWGLGPSWRASMGLAVLAFAATPWLGAGDGVAFFIICVASGLTLGADLALPGALLTGVIHQAGAGGRDEGRYLGWWTCASKLNLALAGGLALPLLSWAGYRSASTDASALSVLAWTYAGLPCFLKLCAAIALWRAERRNPTWRKKT